MIYGLSGTPLDQRLRYAGAVDAAATNLGFSPPLLYAIAWVETINGEYIGLWPSAADVVSDDGGHGLCQLTASYPPGWADPYTNASYAITTFLRGALAYWHGAELLSGDDLARCMADEFNEGRSAALKWHNAGNADAGTTGSDYGARALAVYHAIVAGNYSEVSLNAALGAVL